MKKLNFFNKIIRDMLWKSKIFQFKVEIIPDNPNPDNLRKNIVYVVGGKEFVKWAYLKCPCGCNDDILLSLNKTSFPSWQVIQDGLGRASISPSIKKKDGCKSHFFIKQGKLIWAHSF